MWQFEHVGRAALEAIHIWEVLADVNHWAEWDTSMSSAQLRGPFAVGAEVVMTPHGQDPITSMITVIDPLKTYADETMMDGLTLRFSHTLTQLSDGGTQVVHRLEISGETADTIGPQLGPAITEDFPEAMQALFVRAAQRANIATA